MNYDIIIAHHNENSFRERNIIEIINYYVDLIKDTSRIIVVEQNTNTPLPVHPCVLHIHEQYDTDQFWKTKLLNRGIKESDKEAFLIIDSDAILPSTAMQYINDTPVESISLLFPYNQVKMMNESETRRWIKTKEVPTTVDTSYQKLNICYTGFFMAVTRKTYEAINGFDECYVGWGGEDDAFVIKALRICNVEKIPFESKISHMYHPRKDTDKHLISKQYKQNKYCTQALKLMNIDDIRSYCLGNLDLVTYVKEHNINEESLIKRIFLKNNKFYDVPLTGVHVLPDVNGEYNMSHIMESLYHYVGRRAFIVNMNRVIDGSTDDDEKEYYRTLINETCDRLN